MPLEPSITFMAMAPAREIAAGIDRSTLPGPEVITSICPSPTMTNRAENVTAADMMSAAPRPPE